VQQLGYARSLWIKKKNTLRKPPGSVAHRILAQMGATNSNVGLDCDRLDWRSIAARNGLQVQGCAVSENLALWLAHQLRQLSDVHSNAPRLILALSLSSYGDRTDPAYGDRTHPATNCVPAHAVPVATEKARPSSVQAGPAIILASSRFQPTSSTKCARSTGDELSGSNTPNSHASFRFLHHG
jgi:hypothetical protein